MKRPSFFEGAFIGMIASIAGSLLFVSLTWLLSSANIMQLVVTALSFFYMIYLLTRSQEKSGRVIVFTLWSIITTIAWLLTLPLLLFVLAHVAMLWLIRALYFYTSIVTALMDLGITSASLVVAIGAGLHTNSLFLGLWCFFLMQALFVFIPSQLSKKSSTRSLAPQHEDTFAAAHRSAEAALHKLSSIS